MTISRQSAAYTQSSCAKAGSRKDIFSVGVIATVSAGKSSLINAMVGRELLHAANEAATACVTRIEHRKQQSSFSGVAYRDSGVMLNRVQNVTHEHVRMWNSDDRVARVSLAGRFDGAPRLAPGLVVYDTPGPNNSQNDGHAKAVTHALRSIPFNVMMYVMNASQFGTRDDRATLDMLHARYDDLTTSVYFLLNKVDLLDPEKGEDVAMHVRHAYGYLLEAGFDNPIVIPTVADAALYARKALNGEVLTRVQRSKLRNTLDAFDADGRHIVDAAIIPDRIRNKVSGELDRLDAQLAQPANNPRAAEQYALKQVVARSGIRTAEFLIQHKRSLVGKT